LKKLKLETLTCLFPVRPAKKIFDSKLFVCNLHRFVPEKNKCPVVHIFHITPGVCGIVSESFIDFFSKGRKKGNYLVETV